MILMNRVRFFALTIIAVMMSCSRETVTDAGVTLSCVEPEFLKPGDRIALISTSYHTPAGNIDTAAMVLREWGFEPVIGANVDKEFLGHYAGTPKERKADLDWALFQIHFGGNLLYYLHHMRYSDDRVSNFLMREYCPGS